MTAEAPLVVVIPGSGVYGQSLFGGALHAAMERGWRVSVRPYLPSRPRDLLAGPPDAVIAQVGVEPLGALLSRRGIPTVDTDGSFGRFGFPQVRHDAHLIADRIVEHLRSIRCTRVAYLGPADRDSARRHATAIAALCAPIALEFSSFFWHRHWCSAHETQAQMQQRDQTLLRWLRRLPKPCGMVVWGDLHPVVVQQLVQREWQVPRDVALVATNHDPVLHLGHHGISGVRLQPWLVGQRAVDLLECRREGAVEHLVEVPPAEVVVAASSQSMVDRIPLVRTAMDRIAATDNPAMLAPAVLAKHLQCGRRTLERAFRSAGYAGIAAVVLRRKIDLAVEILRARQDLSVKQVAARAGFSNGSHLAKVLRQVRGTSPSAIRTMP